MRNALSEAIPDTRGKNNATKPIGEQEQEAEQKEGEESPEEKVTFD